MSEVVATAQQGLAGKYPPYPEYKDSGVEWLGGIPNHWISVQSRRLFSLRNTRARAGDRQLAATQKYGVIFQDIFMELEGRRVVQVQIGAEILKHVEPGDFVISMRSFQGGIEYCPYEGCVSSAYVPLTPIKWVHPDYFRYLFKSSPYIQALQSTSNLVRDGQALRFENFSLVDLPVVPIDEQRTIATFLDYETARIDRLIAQQQLLIELLKEKRQAVISHAVTKGLNPNAPMKDSGVEWLGQVPEHWVVTNLKYVFDSLDYRRIPLSAEQRGERQGDYPYYGASGVIDGVDDYLFDEECVLVGEDGANLIMRSTPLAFVVSGKYWVNNHAHILRMHDGLNRYWAAVINNVDIKPIVSGSAQPKLTAEALGNIKVAFPQDTTEREELLIHINAETPKFDELIGHANQQVILLKERRSALISAAVTGKIDLRGWTPPAEEVAA